MALALAQLPAWPAMLNAEAGGAYIGMGEEAFRSLMAAHGVRPRDCGNARVLWRKADVDRVIDNLPARSDIPNDATAQFQAAAPIDPALSALEAIRAASRQSARKG